jgi:phospholipase C
MQSSTADDQLNGPGSCGTATGVIYQGRCGYGPRLPLLVISPYAKANYVDHTTTDQSSILRFIEDNWSLGRIGDNSTDAIAGPINGMFNFGSGGGTVKATILDPGTGTVVSGGVTGGSGGGGGTGGSATTTAVAGPKNAAATTNQFQLDGTKSTSFDGKPLMYQWALITPGPTASISNGNTATPLVQFNSGAGAYSFVLTVTDSSARTASDTVTISYIGH